MANATNAQVGREIGPMNGGRRNGGARGRGQSPGGRAESARPPPGEEGPDGARPKSGPRPGGGSELAALDRLLEGRLRHLMGGDAVRDDKIDQ